MKRTKKNNWNNNKIKNRNKTLQKKVFEILEKFTPFI